MSTSAPESLWTLSLLPKMAGATAQNTYASAMTIGNTAIHVTIAIFHFGGGLVRAGISGSVNHVSRPTPRCSLRIGSLLLADWKRVFAKYYGAESRAPEVVKTIPESAQLMITIDSSTAVQETAVHAAGRLTSRQVRQPGHVDARRRTSMRTRARKAENCVETV